MKFRKLLCTIFVLAALMLSFVASAAPVAAPVANDADPDTSTVSPRAEETEWYFRIYDGKVQKRLWSYTRGIWLTDWIDC